jgi:hypothetical protein
MENCPIKIEAIEIASTSAGTKSSHADTFDEKV